MYCTTVKGCNNHETQVRGDWPGKYHGHGSYTCSKHLLITIKPMKKTKRTFTNSQKIRLRLKVYFDANDTGYDDFEEFYSAFTESLLENIEFIATMFLK